MTDSIDSLLAGDDYDINYDDMDGVDYADYDDALEGVSLDDFFRSFSFHRVNGDDPFEYGGNVYE
ncbi:hypothetical protein [uncultured Mediterranean phage uvMED]|nr:hypothetical protein [uncultured Mediterranean phage uvMED]